MAEDIHIEDLRGSNDDSLGPVPRSAVDTYEKLASVFHLTVDRSLGWDITPPGELCYKLVGFYLRTGVAEYIPKVYDISGNPLANILVLRHWPGAPQLPQGVKPAYFNNGVGGFTNGNGDAGFPYGGDSVFRDSGGPDSLWASANPPGQQPQYADCVKRLGWHGATDHMTANPIFQIVRKEGSTLPPATSDRMLFIYDADGTVFGRIALASGAGPTGQKKMVVMAGGEPVGYAIIQEPIE